VDQPQKPKPIICSSKRVLLEKVTVFVRDMALQHKIVRLAREGNMIFCMDPRRAWVVMEGFRIH
jgi:hypothetical protein